MDALTQTRPDPLAGLDPDQHAAATHRGSPLLLLAGPGAGKTRTIIARIASLLAGRECHPSAILAVTFTVRAADEMRLRLVEAVGTEAAAGVTACTLHSLCARIVRSHAQMISRNDNYTIYDDADIRRAIDAAIRANPDLEGAEAKTVAAAISLAKNRLEGSADIRQRTPVEGDVAPGLLADAWDALEAELKRSNALTFDCLLTQAVWLLEHRPELHAHYRRRYEHILVDEYQDTCPAQARLVELLGAPDKQVCVVADDDQCLVQGTRITMADGSTRLIEAIQAEDMVLSNLGGGRLGPARVTRTRTHRAKEGVEVTLKSGRRLVSTPEHTHFAGFVPQMLAGRYLTYLMYKRNVGYRVGVAAGLYAMARPDGSSMTRLGPAQRCLHERADAVWIVAVHEDEREARLAEMVLAARYGLPTLPFRAAKGSSAGVSYSQRHIDRAFSALDTVSAAERLARGEGLSLEHPHHAAQSHTGRTIGEPVTRRTVTLTMCADRRHATPLHRLTTQGLDTHGREVLESMGLRLYRGTNRARWCLSVTSKDYAKLLKLGGRICAALGARLHQVARLAAPGQYRQLARSLPFVPASVVRPGMAMLDESGELDLVETVSRVSLRAPVYDLDVEFAHNYVAEGIVTHNCLYGFRGADSGGITRFARAFPTARELLLSSNYRCAPEILGAATRCVAHNQARKPKDLVARRPVGGFVQRVGLGGEEEEAAWLASMICGQLDRGRDPAEILVLCRTTFATGGLQRTLATRGVAHRVLGDLGLYERSEVKDALAYLTLVANPLAAAALRRVSGYLAGVGPATVETVLTGADAHRGDLLAACRNAGELGVRAEAVGALSDLGATLSHIRGEMLAGRSLAHVCAETLTIQGGPVATLKAAMAAPDPGPGAPAAEHKKVRGARRRAQGALEDLRSLHAAIGAWEASVEHEGQPDLSAFLEHAHGLGAQTVEEHEGRVTISTIHRAKGTEAQVVCLLGCEEGLLPHWRSLEEVDPAVLEEERRLFYVATTRAKDVLIATHVAQRAGRETRGPSRFLHEAGI